MLSREEIRKLRAIKLNEGAKFNFRVCNDEHRFTVKYQNGKFEFLGENRSSLKCIVFILESPHKSEYKVKNNIRPASGKTGDLFKDNLFDILLLSQCKHQIFTNGEYYEVWLVNAIQYQTSLGVATKHYRSIIFQAAWFHFGEKNFIERMNNFTSKEELIIFNSCTIGNTIDRKCSEIIKQLPVDESTRKKVKFDDINLKELVINALKEYVPNKFYNSAHPIQWLTLVS